MAYIYPTNNPADLLLLPFYPNKHDEKYHLGGGDSESPGRSTSVSQLTGRASPRLDFECLFDGFDPSANPNMGHTAIAEDAYQWIRRNAGPNSQFLKDPVSAPIFVVQLNGPPRNVRLHDISISSVMETRASGDKPGQMLRFTASFSGTEYFASQVDTRLFRVVRKFRPKKPQAAMGLLDPIFLATQKAQVARIPTLAGGGGFFTAPSQAQAAAPVASSRELREFAAMSQVASIGYSLAASVLRDNAAALDDRVVRVANNEQPITNAEASAASRAIYDQTQRGDEAAAATHIQAVFDKSARQYSQAADTVARQEVADNAAAAAAIGAGASAILEAANPGRAAAISAAAAEISIPAPTLSSDPAVAEQQAADYHQKLETRDLLEMAKQAGAAPAQRAADEQAHLDAAWDGAEALMVLGNALVQTGNKDFAEGIAEMSAGATVYGTGLLTGNPGAGIAGAAGMVAGAANAFNAIAMGETGVTFQDDAEAIREYVKKQEGQPEVVDDPPPRPRPSTSDVAAEISIPAPALSSDPAIAQRQAADYQQRLETRDLIQMAKQYGEAAATSNAAAEISIPAPALAADPATAQRQADDYQQQLETRDLVDMAKQAATAAAEQPLDTSANGPVPTLRSFPAMTPSEDPDTTPAPTPESPVPTVRTFPAIAPASDPDADEPMPARDVASFPEVPVPASFPPPVDRLAEDAAEQAAYRAAEDAKARLEVAAQAVQAGNDAAVAAQARAAVVPNPAPATSATSVESGPPVGAFPAYQVGTQQSLPDAVDTDIPITVEAPSAPPAAVDAETGKPLPTGPLLVKPATTTPDYPPKVTVVPLHKVGN